MIAHYCILQLRPGGVLIDVVHKFSVTLPIKYISEILDFKDGEGVFDAIIQTNKENT